MDIWNNCATRRATRKICVCAASGEVFCLQNPRERQRNRKEKTTSQRSHRTFRRTVDKRILAKLVRAILAKLILKHQQQLKNFNMLLSVNCDFRVLVLPVTSNFSNVNDWILHSGPSHLALIPLHAKLLFLLITLRRAGI